MRRKNQYRYRNHGTGDEMSKIVEGDWVDVEWENLSSMWLLRVEYVPCATGDSWRLQEHVGENRTILVQNFARMIKCDPPKWWTEPDDPTP